MYHFKLTILMQFVDNNENWSGRVKNIWELLLLFVQIFHKSKTAKHIKYLFKKLVGQKITLYYYIIILINKIF